MSASSTQTSARFRSSWVQALEVKLGTVSKLVPFQAIKGGGSCPFMKAKSKAKDNFKEAILSQPVDVEELGKQGRRKSVCPYYTARSAMPDAQLVLLPYSALLAQVRQTVSMT